MASHHVSSFLALIAEYQAANSVMLDGAHLTLPKIAAIGASPQVTLLLDTAACKLAVDRSRAWVDKAVHDSADIYGITTGFGACSDKRTLHVDLLQVEFVRFLVAGIFNGPGGSDGAQPLSTTRAAIAIRINSLLLGLSGIRWEVLEALAKLVNSNVLPRCPLRGTVTASGDLLPLCYVIGLLVGWRTVKAYVPSYSVEGSTNHVDQQQQQQQLLLPATEALKRAGLQQPVTLRAKEGIALANGTSFATAEAALVLFDAHLLFLLSELCGGLFCEVMYVRTEFCDPVLHEAKHHRGQIEVAATLRWLLEGSTLIQRGDEIHVGRARLKPRQERYAPRSIPHWLGPQLEIIQRAVVDVENEANSANDNPLIDAKNDRSLHGANFQGTYIGVPMDNVRLSIAAMGKLIFALFTELMLEMTNNGLTGNLAIGPDFALDFGLKGVDIAMAAYLSELLHLANPVTTHVQSAEQHNQDVNSLGLISARRTAEAIHLLKMMLASFLLALCQAADLRHLEELLHGAIHTTVQQEASRSALPPSLISELLLVVEQLNVLDYAHNAASPSLPFAASLNTKLLQHIMSCTKPGIDDTEALRSFKDALEKKLAENIEEVRRNFLESQAQEEVSGRVRSSKAFPLYRFVRKELQTEVLTGAQLKKGGCYGSPDEDLQKIFDSMVDDKSIMGPVLDCFKGYKPDFLNA